MTLRDLPVRVRNGIHYGMTLYEESRLPGWMMIVDRTRLIAAVDAALAGVVAPQRRGGDRARSGPPPPIPAVLGCPPDGLRASALTHPGAGQSITLTVCERGLSVRGAGAAMDISGIGVWASPIAVSGTMLRRVLARLPWAKVQLAYSDGRLGLEERGLRAREI